MQRTGRFSAQIDQHPPDPRAGRSSPGTCSHATWARIIDSCTTSRAKSRSPINVAAIASRRGCSRRKKNSKSVDGSRSSTDLLLRSSRHSHTMHTNQELIRLTRPPQFHPPRAISSRGWDGGTLRGSSRARARARRRMGPRSQAGGRSRSPHLLPGGRFRS